MALRGIQEYIARDVNNIARVEDEGNIVSIKGNIFLFIMYLCLYHPENGRDTDNVIKWNLSLCYLSLFIG